ncbi:MAG: hypothetical protein AAFV95_11810 [Bacteroidota bacterium]
MRYILFLLPLALLLGSCGKNDEQVLFEIPYQIDFEIPAGLNTLETHVFEIRNIPTRLDSLLSSFGIARADIQSIEPQEAQMDVLIDGLEYGFVRQVNVWVFDQNRQAESFFRDNVPLNTGNRLTLIPTLLSAQDYLMEDRFNLRVELQMQDFSPQFVPTRLRFIYKVK